MKERHFSASKSFSYLEKANSLTLKLSANHSLNLIFIAEHLPDIFLNNQEYLDLSCFLRSVVVLLPN